MTPNYLIVTTTIDTQEEAAQIARALIDKKLAACVQVTPATSLYRWKGKIEESAEFVLSIKTRAALYAEVEEAIRALHPYDVPEIIAVPVRTGSDAYLDWVDTETKNA